MAVNDPNYRYATQTWEADGVRTLYEIAFDGGYIRQSDVVAFSVLVDPATGLTTGRQVHPLTFISETVDPVNEWKSAQVQITPAVPAGRRVVIFRSTQKSSPLVNFTNGSTLTDKNLDLANEQAIFSIAEIMDGLNSAMIDITQQVQEVVDLNTLINNIYTLVLELLAAGGIVSVAPRVWSGVGNGEDTDFVIEGADVNESAFYDTYVAGIGQEPGEMYTVILGDTIAETVIRFATPPPIGAVWFTVLRGFARPANGNGAPVTSLRTPVIDIESPIHFVTKADEFALLRSMNNVDASFVLPEIPLDGDADTKLGTGSYLSIRQLGTAQVIVSADTPNVTLTAPAGYLPRTRAIGSVISLTCEYGDGSEWLISGDLAKE